MYHLPVMVEFSPHLPSYPLHRPEQYPIGFSIFYSSISSFAKIIFPFCMYYPCIDSAISPSYPLNPYPLLRSVHYALNTVNTAGDVLSSSFAMIHKDTVGLLLFLYFVDCICAAITIKNN